MTHVLAQTGARLHFGLILGTPADRWEFGGFGLMVSRPGWKLRVQTVEESAAGQTAAAAPRLVHVSGASADAAVRIHSLIDRLKTQQQIPPLQITVEAEIPPHTGLGSGTQLALATTAAVSWLATGQLPGTAEQLAAVSGRSERSAVGTAGFDHGGFLVDRGRSAAAPRVLRYALPDHWRFLLICPRQTQGLSGSAEQQWFQGRREMPRELTARLAWLIEQQLVPAVTSQNAAEFAAALEDYGDAVGSFYAPTQGGIFAHPAIRRLTAQLRDAGIRGAAQSSWGPGICIPAASPADAVRLQAAIPAEVDGCPLHVTLSEPLNTGARILREAPADPIHRLA